MKGARILVVEDEPLLALDLGRVLEDSGYFVLGPAGSAREALALIARNSIDAAMLDLNLNGEMTFLLADALSDAGIPFLVLTGHSRDLLPPHHRMRPYLQKPYRIEQLLEQVEALLVGPDEDRAAARRA